MKTFYFANYKNINNDYLRSILQALENYNYNFIYGPSLFSKNKNYLKNKKNRILFLLSLPYILIKAKKEIKKYNNNEGGELIIICSTWIEKVVYMLLNKKGQFKLQWWFLPQENIGCKIFKKRIIKNLKKYKDDKERKIKLIVFHKQEQEKIEKLYKQKATHFPFCIKKTNESHQESIFDNLSKSKKLNFFHRYFTVALLVDLNRENYIETIIKNTPELLKAIPNTQLLIISPSTQKENLKWLVKKLAIEKNVWFLNKKEPIKNWLENSNLFLIANKKIKLPQYYYLSLAIKESLAIITLKEQNINYLFKEKKLSLESSSDINTIISSFVSLYRDPYLRKNLSENANYLANNNLNLEKQLKRLQEILK